MSSDVQIYLCFIQTIIMVFGFIFVILQFRKYVSEISKTHDWNRRKASQEACYKFLDSRIQDSWKPIHKAIVDENKTYDELEPKLQEDLLQIVYYFENLGISIKNNIVDEDIIWDYFGAIWPFCYECAKSLVTKYQLLTRDDMIFEHFVLFAQKFEERNRAIDSKKRAAGTLPGKPLITGK